jgi:hypothetical protein
MVKRKRRSRFGTLEMDWCAEIELFTGDPCPEGEPRLRTRAEAEAVYRANRRYFVHQLKAAYLPPWCVSVFEPELLTETHWQRLREHQAMHDEWERTGRWPNRPPSLLQIWEGERW